MFVCIYTHMYACVCMCVCACVCPSVKLDAACACFIKGAQIWRLDYYLQWLAASGAVVKWKRAGQLALRAMFPEFERLCHVSWQLAPWVWILRHKFGPFPLCLCFLVNVSPNCFHIDLITQPWRRAWNSLVNSYRLLRAAWPPSPSASVLGGERGGCECLSPGLGRLILPTAETNCGHWTRTAGVWGCAGGWGHHSSYSWEVKEQKEEKMRDTQVPSLRFLTHKQRDPIKTNIKFPNFPTPFQISSGSSFWAMRQ